jgi:hypothetical protein
VTTAHVLDDETTAAIRKFVAPRRLAWSNLMRLQALLVTGLIAFSVWEGFTDRQIRWVEIALGCTILATFPLEELRPAWFPRAWRPKGNMSIRAVRLANLWFASRYPIFIGWTLLDIGARLQQNSTDPVLLNIAASLYIAGAAGIITGPALYLRRRTELREGAGYVIERVLDHHYSSDKADVGRAISELVVGFRSGFRRRSLLNREAADIVREVYHVTGDIELVRAPLQFALVVLGVRFEWTASRRKVAVAAIERARRRGAAVPLDAELRLLRDMVLTRAWELDELYRTSADADVLRAKVLEVVVDAAREFASVLSAVESGRRDEVQRVLNAQVAKYSEILHPVVTAAPPASDPVGQVSHDSADDEGGALRGPTSPPAARPPEADAMPSESDRPLRGV